MDDDAFLRPCLHLPDQVSLSVIASKKYTDCVQDNQSQGQEGSDGLRHLWPPLVSHRLLQRSRRTSPICLFCSQPMESEAALSPELWIQQLQVGFYIPCLTIKSLNVQL